MRNKGKKFTGWERISGMYIEELLPRIATQARKFLQEQHRFVTYAIYGLCAVLLVGLAGGGWYLYNKNYEEKAWVLYSNVQQQITTVANPQLVEVAQALRAVADKYPRSKAAAVANYRLGSLYYYSGDADAAITAYTAYVDRASDKEELTTIALISLGHAYEMKGELEKALTNYQRAAKTPNGNNFSSINFQNIARIYEAKGDRQQALEYYGKALASVQDPVAKRIIQSKMAAI